MIVPARTSYKPRFLPARRWGMGATSGVSNPFPAGSYQYQTIQNLIAENASASEIQTVVNDLVNQYTLYTPRANPFIPASYWQTNASAAVEPGQPLPASAVAAETGSVPISSASAPVTTAPTVSAPASPSYQAGPSSPEPVYAYSSSAPVASSGFSLSEIPWWAWLLVAGGGLYLATAK